MTLNVKPLLAVLALAIAVGVASAQRIERRAGEFTATRFLGEDAKTDIRQRNLLRGGGVATYAFDVAEAGWYELYVQAAQWSTELLLDGKPLIYTAFASGIWPDKDKASKVMNVYLTAGAHELTFSRVWHPGLPYMSKFFLEPATDVTGRARVTVGPDRLAFRRGETFTVHLQAGQGPEAAELHCTVTDTDTDEIVWETTKTVAAGTGNVDEDLAIPTDREGIFDLAVKAGDGRYADRIIQYVVVDPAKPDFPAELTRERLYTVDCVATEPDYHQGPMRTVTMPWGSYRESGDKGRETGTAAADWFAYTLDLPEIQVPYVLEIEYPDDDERTVPIVLVEQEYGPPEPALGYFSGGTYPLSNKMLTQEFYFFPRVTDPRVLFYNWSSGQRAAVAKIHVNRIADGFPSLHFGPAGRCFGMYQEEPLRHLCNFGAMPEGDSWRNILLPTRRAAQLMNCVGTNLWNPTIAVYQSMLWPGESIPGYQLGILPPGPTTLKEPMKKDILRLMLLTCEKYGLNFVGDLHIPANNVLMRTLDERFGGTGDLDDDGHRKPWLIVSNKGEVGLKSPYKPYYNALYPGVQEWTAGVMAELAGRYGDSPAFKGVSIRFMGWTFAGWQCFPSIAWGYGDYTVARFEKDTGIDVPVADDDPERFGKRYDYLLANQYDAWVGWRTRQMHEYHARLAETLTRVRPDLKLYLYLTGADFGHTATPADFDRLGWAGVLRETGIDLDLYKADTAIVPYPSRGYPDGGNRGHDPLRNAESRDASASLQPLAATAQAAPGGTMNALYFGSNHEGGYVKFELLGYDKKNIPGNKQTIYPDSTVYPAGIHYLERFANAMADANFTWISEGTHGYGIGQPMYLHPFLREYRALPVVGMQPLGAGDPVALWYGRDGDRTVFYVVNRTWYAPVAAKITFPGAVHVTRLSTGEAVAAPGGVLSLNLTPYQFLAFAADAAPAGLAATIPAADAKAVAAMIDSAAAIVNTQPDTLSLLPVSPVDLANARAQLAEAREHLAAGRCWRARQAIQHLDMVKIYSALDTWPTGLRHRQTPPQPEGAMLPNDLAGQLAAGKIVDGAMIAATLSGQPVLTWTGDPAELAPTVPYAGMYRIWYAYPLGNGYGAPALAVDGQVETAGLPPNTAPAWGLQVTKPLSLTAGSHRLAFTRTAAEAGLFYLHFEPVYHDLAPADFAAVGPFPGAPDVRKSDNVYGSIDADLPIDPAKLTATGTAVNGAPLKWVTPVTGTSLTGTYDTGYIDLYNTFKVMSNVVYAAETRIVSPAARPAELKLGADYWAKVFLNGEVVFQPQDRPRAAPKKGEVAIPITLKQGENLLYIRLHAGSAGSGLWVAITDPGDLKFTSGL